MARPWDYPRWRRIVMQGSLWVILAATLGLAQVITAQRQGVPVGLQPAGRVGPVMVQIPENWILSQETPETDMLVAGDPAGFRAMTISVEDASMPAAAGARPIEFKGLHQTGTLTVLRPVRPSAEGYGGPQNELMATATLPSGGVVTIRLLTQRPSSDDRRVIQAVANGITPADGKTRRVRRPVVPVHPEDFD